MLNPETHHTSKLVNKLKRRSSLNVENKLGDKRFLYLIRMRTLSIQLRIIPAATTSYLRALTMLEITQGLALRSNGLLTITTVSQKRIMHA